MKKTIDQLSTLLEQNNIALPKGAKKSDVGQPTEDRERCHALKASLTQLKAYLIDYGASNHMVSSKESFSTLTLSGIPTILPIILLIPGKFLGTNSRDSP